MLNNKVKSVGIIGGGWLGLPLTMQLIEQGHHLVTTRQQGELIHLLSVGADAEHLSLPSTAVELAEKKVFKQDCLVIAIPPKLKQGKTNYPEKIAAIVEQAEQHQVKQIILLSTTAIYNGLSGEVNESSTLNFTADKVRTLYQGEQAALAFNGHCQVLRLAGLVGPHRHPGRFLSRKPELANNSDAVNLIHLDDVIGVIVKLIKGDEHSGVYNVVANTHVSKSVYYHLAAQSIKLTLSSPCIESISPDSKIVLADKMNQQLGYHNTKNDLLAWLKQAADSAQ